MKERYQNPVIRDEVKLRLFTYNANNRASLDEVTKVEIYFLDPNEKTAENPEGKRLVKVIDSSEVEEEETGLYSVTVELEENLFLIGNYYDEWSVVVGSDQAVIANNFQVFPDLWYTTPIPIVYDLNFSFRPNRLKKGSKRYLSIDITPNVPNRDQLYAYYENLAITSPIKISIEQMCGPCVPVEEDLRLIVDSDDVVLREKCVGYYFLDTSDMELGMYNVWFEVELGGNTFISEKQQLQIA